MGYDMERDAEQKAAHNEEQDMAQIVEQNMAHNRRQDREEKLKNRILAAAGEKKAELVFKHAGVVNVFTEEIEYVDVAVEDGFIVGVGSYEGEREVDLSGHYLCPGFMDGHIHLESSMVSPREFERCVLPHGTTTVITDPHEIANVAGLEGIDFILEKTKDLWLDVFVMLPSCVPATGLDESGAVLEAEDLERYYENPRILGLAELMNSYGTIKGQKDILQKIAGARESKKRIDGHAPFLGGKGLNAYVTAGVTSDHECSDRLEALEKLSRGQWIMIREGTAAKNLDALIPILKEPYYHRCMFVTDDKHPGDLISLGHMDYIIRRAISQGVNPIHAVKMASYHTALYFGLSDRGAIAPGYRADLVVVEDFNTVKIGAVYKDGVLVSGEGACPTGRRGEDGRGEEKKEEKGEIGNQWNRIFHSFHMEEIQPSQLYIEGTGKHQRVITLTPNELITGEMVIPWQQEEGQTPGLSRDMDIVKMAVFERHHNTGHAGLGFLHGYGLKRGAVATSVAHDSHNLIVAGTDDRDMALAGNCVRQMGGGLAYVEDGVVKGTLPLPIAGLMSLETAVQVEENLNRLKEMLRDAGIPKTIDPFMTLAFASLPVIPKLRLNTYGLIDVDRQAVVESVFT